MERRRERECGDGGCGEDAHRHILADVADFNLIHGALPDGPWRANFVHRGIRVADEIGAERLGASLYELEPGEKICPYHYHYANEEWLFVVSGAPTVRAPDGDHVLRAGRRRLFPDGAAGRAQRAQRDVASRCAS